MIRTKFIRMAATAWSLASIARDLWSGLNAGSLHYDPDGDLVDEDPPRPEVVWVDGPGQGLHEAHDQAWTMRVRAIDADAEWSVVADGDRTQGRTRLGVTEAKRRAEEALAVMLELQT